MAGPWGGHRVEPVQSAPARQPAQAGPAGSGGQTVQPLLVIATDNPGVIETIERSIQIIDGRLENLPEGWHATAVPLNSFAALGTHVADNLKAAERERLRLCETVEARLHWLKTMEENHGQRLAVLHEVVDSTSQSVQAVHTAVRDLQNKMDQTILSLRTRVNDLDNCVADALEVVKAIQAQRGEDDRNPRVLIMGKTRPGARGGQV